MSRAGGDATRIAFAAVGAGILLGGVWYTATLRAENQLLREQMARYESGFAAGEARPRAAGPPESSEAKVATPSISRPRRILSDEQRAAMRDVLSAEPGRKVWFAREPRDPEATSFQRELEAVYRESGWEVAGSSEAGYRVKAGLYLFMADAEPAPHVKTAQRGLEAAGLPVFAGTGYRAYYQERKQEDPGFRGHELAPGQDFVIVVGPNPDSAT